MTSWHRGSPRACELGVRPAHVNRNDRVWRHSARRVFRRDLADETGERRERSDRHVSAEGVMKHVLIMRGAVANKHDTLEVDAFRPGAQYRSWSGRDRRNQQVFAICGIERREYFVALR